jgi:hypothetical protein
MNTSILEILTEEKSMEDFLRGLLPRILPNGYSLDVNCFIRPHQGKSDLARAIPNKFRAYLHFPLPVKVLIIHDQDANDCLKLKQGLKDAIGNTNVPFIIRIACKELENWYIGDLQAIESIYPRSRATQHQEKAKYRNPDNVFGSYELQTMIKSFRKTEAARAIGRIINIEANRSRSFQHLVSAVRELTAS